ACGCPRDGGSGWEAGCHGDGRARAGTSRGRRPVPGSIASVLATGIHHLGVAVEDLDAALSTYERLFGAEVEHRATVPDQGVEAASLRGGDGRGELLEPTAEDAPVGRFLTNRGRGMHPGASEVPRV